MTRHATLPYAVHETHVLHQEAVRLLRAIRLLKPVRLVGVSVQRLEPRGTRRVVQPALKVEA